MSGRVGVEQTPDIEAVLAEHSIAGAVDPPQGAGQTIPELHILCLKCGWMSASAYGAHLAPVLAAAVREARAAAQAEALDEMQAWVADFAGPATNIDDAISDVLRSVWQEIGYRAHMIRERDRADRIAVDASHEAATSGKEA